MKDIKRREKKINRMTAIGGIILYFIFVTVYILS
jgi:Ca2+/Na+ antiporter